jgi:putative ABC transport system permease protein
MRGLLQDLRYALRQLRKNSAFSATVVITLALAIGVSTAVFSVIYATLIRPLPYSHPDRISYLVTYSPQGYTQPASYPEYLDWRRDNHAFSALAAFNAYGSANVEGSAGPVALPRVLATDNFFDVFGVAPFLGRTFAPGEDQPGRDDVMVLSYEVWQQYFGSRADAIGRAVKIDGLPYTVIGVMPAGFRFPINLRDAIYTPPHIPKELAQARGSHWLPTIARLKDGISLQQAEADMNRVMADVGGVYPESKGRRAQLQNVAGMVLGSAGGALQILVFAVLALLAIGCINVAGLLLAQGVHREKEIALRSAIGAARLRIVRQMLTEALLLGILGALAGVITGEFLLTAVQQLLIAALARGAEVRFDYRALFVAISLAILTSVVAALAPALRLSSIAPSMPLKSGGSAGSTRAQHRLRAGFILAQVALAMVLLVTSGLLLRVLAGLRSTDLGFDPDGLLTTHIFLSAPHYKDRDATASFYRPLLDRVQAIPGVQAAGLIGELPIQSWGNNSDMHIIGHPPDPPNQERLAETRLISPSYFKTFGITLARGRLLDERMDTPTSQPVIVVNEAFVHKFFSNGEDPIGKYVEGWMVKLMIVGVVRSIHQNIYGPPMAEIDFSMYQIPPKDEMDAVPDMSLVVRTAGKPEAIVSDLRNVFHELDPGLPFREPLTMRQVVADVLVFERLENWLFGTFATLAVLLAIVGLYALISHEVELSTRDIGVRMALGATRISVVGEIYRRVAIMLCGGAVAGVLLTAAVRKLISAIVTLEPAKDAIVILALSFGFFLIGAVAVFIPARRAAKVDPMVALRYE